jgi:hypothetical protein
VLAEWLGIEPSQEGVALVKEIYADWDTNEFKSFADFVRELRGAK